MNRILLPFFPELYPEICDTLFESSQLVVTEVCFASIALFALRENERWCLFKQETLPSAFVFAILLLLIIRDCARVIAFLFIFGCED